MTDYNKLTEAKMKLAQREHKPGKRSLSERIPPGQHLVNHLPILDLGIIPELTTANWSLTLGGEIHAEQTLNWADFQQLPRQNLVVDIHCVTTWSRLDVPWAGVSASELIRMAQPKPNVNTVVLHSADGYTTNVPLSVLMDDDVLLADTVDGQPLPIEHGGPVRMVVPKRYFWKSAKWITAMIFHTSDQPGFWEVRGYHNDADPFKEERFS
jgi:DMSO/TMAO reductase YedYZ molybdopterin-dependent catalytic subunit